MPDSVALQRWETPASKIWESGPLDSLPCRQGIVAMMLFPHGNSAMQPSDAWKTHEENKMSDMIKNASKTLNARSLELSKSAATLGKEIQSHLIDIAKHVAIHGDTSPAVAFLSMMERADKDGKKNSIIRADAIRNWLADFAFCKFGKDKDTGRMTASVNKKNRAESAEDNHKAHITKARTVIWNKYTPEKESDVGSFDIDEMIDAIIKRVEKTIDDVRLGDGRFKNQTAEKRIGNKLDSERLTALLALKRAA